MHNYDYGAYFGGVGRAMSVDINLIKSLGPTDEQRKQFGQTYLGTLFGQGIVFIGLILIYVLVLIALNNNLKTLELSLGKYLTWVAVAVPLICIVLFSMLPALWRASRERRLRAGIISGDQQFKAGYFRLYAYGEVDRDKFNRLDAAGETILNWLRSAEMSPLYLSGASGAGKSSLLAADVLPKLRGDGWTVVETRLFDNPIERVRATIVKFGPFSPERPPDDLSLREILVKSARVGKKEIIKPLLLVIDQFEEFLILNDEKQRADFSTFLADLFKNPIDGLRILLVFRSDYRPLVFKLNLPALIAGLNWQELAPYRRGEANYCRARKALGCASRAGRVDHACISRAAQMARMADGQGRECVDSRRRKLSQLFFGWS